MEYIRTLRTEIMAEYPVMSTSQGTYVRIEQTSEAIRVTYEICRARGEGVVGGARGLELRTAGSRGGSEDETIADSREGESELKLCRKVTCGGVFDVSGIMLRLRVRRKWSEVCSGVTST